MIDFATQLKIQAFLDGELSGSEAREITSLVAGNAEAAALLAEFKNTRRALRETEVQLRVPEAREFYWSKIRREIERQPAAESPAPLGVNGWFSFVRWLKPVGTMAVLTIVSIVTWQMLERAPSRDLVTAQVDADAITFQDNASGTTFVWFNYPAENDVANRGGADTLN